MDEPQPIEGEDAPDSFDNGISDGTYMKLSKVCVSIESDGGRDYYGGYATYDFYQCNIKTLYRELVNREIIKEEFSD